MPISYIQAAEELQLLRGSAGTVQEKIEALRELVESINVEGTGSNDLPWYFRTSQNLRVWRPQPR